MKRVKKGERYWFINSFGEAVSKIESGIVDDVKRFEKDNYFYTKEEAESMVERIRKVLKGADVIEMPSKEDVYNEEFKTNPYLFCEDGAAVVGAHQGGFNHCFEWLKSKIVK